MNFSSEKTQSNQKYKQFNTQTPLNKSNITLWKSRYNSSTIGEDKKLETDYIDNLKKQIYFMEMELKLMKERDREIEKSGGISKI